MRLLPASSWVLIFDPGKIWYVATWNVGFARKRWHVERKLNFKHFSIFLLESACLDIRKTLIKLSITFPNTEKRNLQSWICQRSSTKLLLKLFHQQRKEFQLLRQFLERGGVGKSFKKLHSKHYACKQTSFDLCTACFLYIRRFISIFSYFRQFTKRCRYEGPQWVLVAWHNLHVDVSALSTSKSFRVKIASTAEKIYSHECFIPN